jgi:hypothetical protein
VGGHDDGDAARLLDGLRVRQAQGQALGRQVALVATGQRGPGGVGLGAQLVRDDADERRAGRGGGGEAEVSAVGADDALKVRRPRAGPPSWSQAARRAAFRTGRGGLTGLRWFVRRRR